MLVNYYCINTAYKGMAQICGMAYSIVGNDGVTFYYYGIFESQVPSNLHGTLG